MLPHFTTLKYVTFCKIIIQKCVSVNRVLLRECVTGRQEILQILTILYCNPIYAHSVIEFIVFMCTCGLWKIMRHM